MSMDASAYIHMCVFRILLNGNKILLVLKVNIDFIYNKYIYIYMYVSPSELLVAPSVL